MAALPDHYRTLQVHVEAEPDVIRAAYRTLARRQHPDGGGRDEEMARLNEAYAVLIDPRSRAAYDAQRRTAGQPMARGSRRPSTAPMAPPAESPATARPAPGPAASTASPSGSVSAAPSARVGSPTGTPSGSVLTFGRYAGWSLGEIARRDPEFLEWLDRVPIGRPFRPEIDAILRAAGRRTDDPGANAARILPR